MAEYNKVLFQEDEMGGWLEDELSQAPPKVVKESRMFSEGEATPVTEVTPKEEKPSQPAPESERPQEPETAPKGQPAGRKGVPLRIEDLHLHEWIHGTGEEVTPDEEDESDHLGL
ncbi:MAG: hypothetical protein ACI3ZY_02420 [Parabacteroides sp.]